MFQEYRDWEKSYREKVSTERAVLDTSGMWHVLQAHIPNHKHFRRWLPALFVCAGLAAILPAKMWVQNEQLKQINKDLTQQLHTANFKLSECQKNAVISPVPKMNSGKISIHESVSRRGKEPERSIQNLSVDTRGNDRQAIVEVLSESISMTSTAVLQSQNNSLIDISFIDRRKVRLPIPKEQCMAQPIAHKSNRKLTTPSGFFGLTSLAGGSTGGGKIEVKNLSISNEVSWQMGLQLQWARYLSPQWYIGTVMTYNHSGNFTEYNATHESRTKTNGITQIVIDDNGEVSSIQGLTGATTFQRVDAKIYNRHHQLYLGPLAAYTFYKGRNMSYSVFSSVQWLLASGFSGKAPLGDEKLGTSSTPQWLYQLRYPLLNLGLDATRRLHNNFLLNMGVQTGFQSDQISYENLVLRRRGFSWNVRLGINKIF